MTQRISIHIATKDRHSEIACLLVSLRSQTFQDWDLVIVDESQTPLNTHVPTMHLLNRLRLEGHKVNLMRNTMLLGVCHARNICIDNDTFKNKLTLRVDDDVILDTDYIEKLYNVLASDYDIASGVTPLVSQPEFIREPKRLNGIVNKIEYDKEGNIVRLDDDCGMCYDGYVNQPDADGDCLLPFDMVVLPADHFRSCALYKTEITDKGIRYESNLSPVGFREESFFSLRARYLGCNIGVDLSAKAWHFMTPSGGCRYPNYQELVMQDNELFMKWSKAMFKEKGEPK
ncbi:MAG: glycosyltransferase [Candidatus Paceibacterota bacterium]